MGSAEGPELVPNELSQNGRWPVPELPSQIAHQPILGHARVARGGAKDSEPIEDSGL